MKPGGRLHLSPGAQAGGGCQAWVQGDAGLHSAPTLQSHPESWALSVLLMLLR